MSVRSIRTRLLLSLLAALAIAAALVAWVTYRNALLDAENLFDYQLRQMALSLRDRARSRRAMRRPQRRGAGLRGADLEHRRPQRLAPRGHRNLPARTVLGLADVVVEGERWRTFGVMRGAG